MIRIVKAGDAAIEKFNARPAFPEEAEQAAFKVLADIRKRGDRAVAEYVAKFEGARLKPEDFLVGDVDFSSLDRKVVAAVKDAHRRVLKFSRASLRKASQNERRRSRGKSSEKLLQGG
jgi:histidinol dehydrogenase